jgi:hypothetical protein
MFPMGAPEFPEGARDELPRLSAGKLDVMLACPRRLAGTLRGDGLRLASPDGPFRLGNALADAIRAAWLVPGNRPLRIDPTPPPGLSLEEAHRFRFAVEGYIDAVGDRVLELDPRSGEVLSARSADGTHLVTGRPDLLFRRSDAHLELHRVLPSPGPARTPTRTSTADLTVAALVRRGQPDWTEVHVVRLWTEDPATCLEQVITGDDIDAHRSRLRDAVATATGAPHPEARPGWCCRDCPLMRACDAVPSTRLEEIVRRP